MEPLITTLFGLVYIVLDIFKWILLIAVVMSWLVAFNVVNTRNRAVYMIYDFVERLTEPVLRPIRSMLPNLGGVDISPVVALLGVWFLQSLLVGYGLVY